MKKRFLTLLLAVVMLLSFSTTALAVTTDTDGKYVDEDTITITKYFGDAYYGYSQSEVFYLVQTDKAGVDASGAEINDADVPNLVVPDSLTDQYKSLTLDGRNSEDYTLDSSVAEDTLYPVVGTVPYTTGGASSLLGIADADGEGTFTITLPEYTEPGTYTYTLREVAGKTLGVTYYSGEITLVVQVYYNPSYDENVDGSEEFIKIVYVNAETEDEDVNVDVEAEEENTDVEYDIDGSDDGNTETDPDASETEKIDYIYNSYSTGSLAITKHVIGNMGDLSGDTTFDITIEFTVPEGLYWDGTVVVTNDTGDAIADALASDSLEIVYEGTKTALYNRDYSAGDPVGYIITLEHSKDDEGYYAADTQTRYYTTYYYTYSESAEGSLTLWNLPEGITYKVYESTYAAQYQGYEWTAYDLSNEDRLNWKTYGVEEFNFDNTEHYYNSAGQLMPGYMEGRIDFGEDQDKLIIINEKDETPNTGLSLDTLPYILILAAVGAGAVVLFFRKRRVLTGMLAALLCVALLPVTAQAATVATATIPVSVTVEGEEGTLETDIPTETYTFTLEAVTENTPLPEETTVTITGAGSAFWSIDYEKVGVYRYIVTQDATALTGDNSACNDRGNYDATVYYVTVSVINLDDGSIGTVVAVREGSADGEKCAALTFVNTYDPVPYTSITVTKTWTDNDQTRPDSIEVQLLDGEEVIETVTLKEGNNWSYTWTGLDPYGDHAWDVKEVAVEGYTAEYTTSDYTITIHNVGDKVTETPEEPEEPEGPDDTEEPGDTEEPEEPDDTEEPGDTEEPKEPDDTEEPDDTDETETPDTTDDTDDTSDDVPAEMTEAQTAADPATTASPQTGDTANILLYAVLMVIAAAAVILLIYGRRRKDR